MKGYIALAIAIPRRLAGTPAEVIARAGNLTTLAERVRRRAPSARLTLFDRAPAVLCDGLPVWGLARGEPGRKIYLCGPA